MDRRNHPVKEKKYEKQEINGNYRVPLSWPCADGGRFYNSAVSVLRGQVAVIVRL